MNNFSEQSHAYVLHIRAYKNTSALVDFFSQDYGLVSAVVQGLYSQKKEKLYWQGVLRPLQALVISWTGKSDLKTLRHVDSDRQAPELKLTGNFLYCGFYLNELIKRSLHHHEPCSDLYALYEQSLLALSQAQDMQVVLRQFEMGLLQALGYGLNLVQDIDGDPIEDSASYAFDPGAGFYKKAPAQSAVDGAAYLGSELIALAQLRLDDLNVKRSAKKILRTALREYIGDKPFVSSQFFKTL